jgi:hypothetical protein
MHGLMGFLSCTAVLWSATSPSAISRTRIGLLPMILGKPPLLRISDIDAEAARAVEGRTDLEIVSSEQLFVAGGNELMTRLHECGADVACIAYEVRPLPIDRALLIVANDLATPPILSIRCVDPTAKECGEESLEMQARDLAAARSALGTVFERLLDRLGFPRRASLNVKTTPSDAVIEIVPAGIAGGSANRYWLLPGHYQVTARREGWVETSTTVEIRGPGRMELELRLDASPASDTTVWLWIAAGIAVVVAGVAVTTVVTHGRDRCVCIGPRGSCPDC